MAGMTHWHDMNEAGQGQHLATLPHFMILEKDDYFSSFS
jgi:hypothetical protein